MRGPCNTHVLIHVVVELSATRKRATYFKYADNASPEEKGSTFCSFLFCLGLLHGDPVMSFRKGAFNVYTRTIHILGRNAHVVRTCYFLLFYTRR